MRTYVYLAVATSIFIPCFNSCSIVYPYKDLLVLGLLQIDGECIVLLNYLRSKSSRYRHKSHYVPRRAQQGLLEENCAIYQLKDEFL
jgi:hypothetical protein